MGVPILDLIREERQRDNATILRNLVQEAFASGLTWQEIAEALGGVSRARVYQIRGPKETP